MNTERLTALMDSLTNHTVLGELLAPVSDALARVRSSAAFARVLNMENFITLGVLRVDSTAGLPVADVPANEGVVKDLRITLSSCELWRLITYRTRRGHRVEFLTNEFDLEPGLIAFLYSRRWEEEKCFDTWKNDFSLAKAWGARVVAIENQARLAIVTSILVALLLHRKMGRHRVEDEKSLRKQDRRQTSKTDGTDRPDWSTPVFRYTSKVSRQVLRFFKHCFHKPASRALYDSQLRPMLLAYL